MNKQQRLAYLNHLGIDSYVSRKPLPGAAPSIVQPVRLDKAVTTEDKEQPEQQTIPSPYEPTSSNSTEARIGIDVAIDQTDHTNKTADVAIQSPSAEIRFSLHCWRINDDLLVLDSHEPGSALPTDTLLLNIIRSIGHPLIQLPHSELLRWPMFSDDQHADDKDQARAMVQAYVQAQVSTKPAKHLLLMGADAAQFTLNRFDDWQSVEGKTIQQWEMTLISVPSLANMLREPLLKRITWRVIKSLRIYSTP